MTDEEVQTYEEAAGKWRAMIKRLIPDPLWREKVNQDERVDKEHDPRSGEQTKVGGGRGRASGE